MKQYKLKVLLVQETHITTTHVEKRKNYTWYCSGTKENGEEGSIFAGVAIVVENTFLNYIQDVQPISDRIMIIKIGHSTPLTLINVYIPNSEHSEDDKRKVYETLEK